MLSYQHEFHAGNAADCMKHICLVQILQDLNKKEKNWTVIDSHSGAGRFFLNDERLLKTSEAKKGIEILFEKRKLITSPVIKDYLEKEEPYFANGEYAGSPELVRLFAREKDSHFLIEKHPQALKSLKENILKPLLTKKGDQKSFRNTKIIEGDSWVSIKALVPPLIKRGLVLIDPSYEDESDFFNAAKAVEEIHKKWNTAIIALWYPLLERRKNETRAMLSSMETCAKTSLQTTDFFRFETVFYNKNLMREEDKAHMYGSGMFFINPPWMLKEKLENSKREIEFLLGKK